MSSIGALAQMFRAHPCDCTTDDFISNSMYYSGRGKSITN